MEHNVLLHFLHPSYSRALYLHKFLLNCLWLLLAVLLCFCHFYSFSFCPKFIMQPVFNSLSFSLHRPKCSFMKSFEYNGYVCVCVYCVLKILLLMFEPHFERICERKGEKYQERIEFERSRLWGKTVESFLFWFEFQLSINFINFLVTHNSIWMNKKDQITLILKAIWFRLKMIQCTQSVHTLSVRQKHGRSYLLL